MSIDGSSDIITSIETLSTQNIEIIHFRDGKILALSPNALAFYKSRDALNDPLGNGLLTSCDIPESAHFPSDDTGWITEYKAGYVGLIDDRVLLITPIAVQLFNNKDDALRNNNAIVRLDLPLS